MAEIVHFNTSAREMILGKVSIWRSSILFTHVQTTSYSLRVSETKIRHLATLSQTSEARVTITRVEDHLSHVYRTSYFRTCIENNYFKTTVGKSEFAHAWVRKMGTLRTECGKVLF